MMINNEKAVVPFKVALSVLWSIVWRWVLIWGAIGIVLGAIWVGAASVYHNMKHNASANVTAQTGPNAGSAAASNSEADPAMIALIYLILIPIYVGTAGYLTKVALSKTHFGYTFVLVKKDDSLKGIDSA